VFFLVFFIISITNELFCLCVADDGKSASLELSHPRIDATGRSAMWAVIALLLVLLIVTGVALFLVVLHYRLALNINHAVYNCTLFLADCIHLKHSIVWIMDMNPS